MVDLNAGDGDPRIAVAVPCWNDGPFLLETLGSLRAEEDLEVMVVDDGSEDSETREILTTIESAGVRVLRQSENRGLSAARNRALEAASAPYFFPLDSDDLAVPGALGAMADRLDESPAAGVCFGDYVEFGEREIFRAVPAALDGYRLLYSNEYPVSSLFRREVLQRAGGWDTRRDALAAHEDWNLWLTLIEQGVGGVYLGTGRLSYARRIHGGRLAAAGRSRHTAFYAALKANHPAVFGSASEYRRRSTLSPLRRLLYPYLYGGRKRWPIEVKVKEELDRRGLWTLTAEPPPEQRRLLQVALDNAARGPATFAAAARDAEV